MSFPPPLDYSDSPTRQLQSLPLLGGMAGSLLGLGKAKYSFAMRSRCSWCSARMAIKWSLMAGSFSATVGCGLWMINSRRST